MEKRYLDMGSVGMHPKGAYDKSVTYSKLQLVTYRNNTYLSKQDGNIGHEPVGEDEWWSLIVDAQTAYDGATSATAAAKRANDAADNAERINAEVQEAEDLRIASEQERTTAETARDNAEQARQGDENLRKTAEENRVSAENDRSDAEQRRTANENSRETAEQMRKTDEADRIRDEKEREAAETSRKAAENLRDTAENDRNDAEQERRQHEDARADAEGKRDTAETLRKQAETGRDNAEQERTTAEQTRKDSEASRVAAEQERTASEQTRQENETARVTAETERVLAELSRQRAEANREQAAKDNKAAIDELSSKLKNAGYFYAGIATPNTIPGTPDDPVFYIATTSGSYSNFNNIEVSKGESAILKWNNGTWEKSSFKPMTDFNSVFDDNGNSLTHKLSELDKEVGYGVSSYEQSSLTLTGYINNEGRIIAGDGYLHSEHIPIAKGQTASVVGKTVTINAHIFAAYNSDGELLDLFTHTKAYNLEEHTYTATSDGEYIIICSNTEQLADLSLSISAIGLKKEIFEIKEDATTIKSTIKAINGDVENLRESLQEESTIVNNIISQNISQFYSNAWVRYNDGLISASSGGAKLYIVNRDSIGNADKLYIHTCTQNETFAAVAFYSSKNPSESTYLKDASVQGKNSKVGYDIEVELPNVWESALILNMSQLDANYSCVIKDTNLAREKELIDTLEKVGELEATIKDPTNKFFYETSPFVEKPFIHHLNQELDSAIPAQSLLDISYAKRLGCNMIEVNPHQCSDGVIVCKHGNGGALGYGLISADGNDYSNTQFSSVTSTWLRENISYARVEGLRIPTLDEFCSVCKQESMMIRVGQNIDVNALNTIRKYLPDNMIYIDSFTSRVEGTFRGIIGRIWNPNSKSIDNFLEDIKDVGKPLDVVIASGTFDSLSDEVLSHAVQECHKKGYTITMTYPNAERSIRALKFGIDTILSNNNLTNHIHFGNEKNVFIGDNDITLNGATMVDGKIQMPKASSIIIPCSKTIKNGVVSLRIRYAGTISSSCGESSGLDNHVSNGESFISLTLAIEDGTNWLHIVANENSVIYDMQVRCSRI